MYSTYSRASVALASALNLPVLIPLHFGKSNFSAARCFKNIGHPYSVSVMVGRSIEQRSMHAALHQLTLFAAGIHAGGGGSRSGAALASATGDVMCDPRHEQRLIAEYCGDDALLQKAMFEYATGSSQFVDSGAMWTGISGKGLMDRCHPCLAPAVESQSSRARVKFSEKSLRT